MDKANIIKRALMAIGIPYDESSYATDNNYIAANSLFDDILEDAFANVGFNLNKVTVTPTRAITPTEVEWDGITHYVYQLPSDFLCFIDSNKEIHMQRDKIYCTEDSGLELTYCNKQTIGDLNTYSKEYLIYYLAEKLCNPLHRSKKEQEMYQKMLMKKNEIHTAELYNPRDPFDFSWEKGGIY